MSKPNAGVASRMVMTVRGLAALSTAVVGGTIGATALYQVARATTVPRRGARELLLRFRAPIALRQIRNSDPGESLVDGNTMDSLHPPIVLGELDHFGRLIVEGSTHECPAAFAAPVPIRPEERVPRERSALELICTGTGLAVRKTFVGREAKGRFVREVRILRALAGSGLNVPDLLELDPEGLTVTTSYLGQNLEQILIAGGARLTGLELSRMAGRRLTPREVHEGYYREGAQAVSQLDSFDTAGVLELLRAVHRRGITIREVSYSNLVRDGHGVVSLIDFEAATLHVRPKSMACLIDRDRDLESFNRAFGGRALTHRRVQEALEQGSGALADIYGVARIGAGLSLGRLFNPSSGFGKWQFLLRRALPDPKGRRIVSLGSNNACVELELLRAGASKVVCYEVSPDYRAQADLLKEACEWVDNTTYELEVRPASMLEVCEDEGPYDLAMALCSLYYLPEGDMRTVAEHLAHIADEVTLQCNVGTNIGREDDDQYRLASLGFALSLVRGVGFSRVSTYAPLRYSRPLVRASTVSDVVDVTDDSAALLTRHGSLS